MSCRSQSSRMTFGRFPQGKNGEILPIEWRVIRTEGERRLLMAEKVLLYMPYNGVEKEADVTWANSPVRGWLNGDFLRMAFSDAEWARIAPVRLRTRQGRDGKIIYGDRETPDPEDTPEGSVTIDRAFLLSDTQLASYLPSEEDRLAFPTGYALSQQCATPKGSDHAVEWWLRRALYVHEGGDYNYFGGFPSAVLGIRPALWVNPEAGAAPRTTGERRKAEYRQSFAVGGQVFFGRYPMGDAVCPIAWRVQAAEGNRRLLICENALDSMPFHEETGPVTWETCTLRKWLNADFLRTAFNPEERAHIAWTRVHTPDSYNGIPGGGDTQDRVFLLSEDEFSNYNQSGIFRVRAAETPYAYSRGECWQEDYWTDLRTWWFRSPGCQSGCFIGYCYEAGGWIGGGNKDALPMPTDLSVSCERKQGVRPALWMVLSD